MTMTSGLRKFALTAHVVTSVGWLGSVAAFLALAIAGLTSNDAQMVRAVYLAMEVAALFVIVPLSLASPLTGVVQSVGTTWGLFRHYWVLAKLLITIPSTVILLLHMLPIRRLAAKAAETTFASNDQQGLRIQLVANAGTALCVLLVATALSVYKPRGMTRYGRRKEAAQLRQDTGKGSTGRTRRWVYVLRIVVLAALLAFVILHLTGGGLGNHAP